MPRYTKELKEYHISRIRNVMIVRPNASGIEIRDVLAKSDEAPVMLHIEYVRNLQKKIIGERTHRLNRASVFQRLAAVGDKKNLLDQRLWAEASDKKNPGVVRVMALQQLMDNEIKLLKSELDAGIYEHTLGTIQTIHRLSAEQKAKAIQVMKQWGIVKDELGENKDIPLSLPSAYVEPSATLNSNISS